ncbi:MAG: hypothetical protein HQL64_08975 [Magnetococcales bacterium]|nr:hypothetical protein [Magnetococcales bacterium]
MSRWAVWWQVQAIDSFWPNDFSARMAGRIVHEQKNLCLRERGTEILKKKLKTLAIHEWQKQRK